MSRGATDSTPLPTDATVRVPASDFRRKETPAELAKLYAPSSDALARVKALNEIEIKLATMGPVPLADRGPQIVAYLKSRPDIEAAGDVPFHNAWGRFRDGRVMILETYPQQPSKPKAHAGAEPREPRARSAKTFTEGKNAVIIDAMGFSPESAASYNASADATGYQSTMLSGVTSATPTGIYPAVKDETALFYINAHGGTGWERTFAAGQDGQKVFSFTTMQRVYDCAGVKIDTFTHEFMTAELAALAACSDKTISSAMWASGEMTYTYAINAEKDDGSWRGWHYGITHRYVENHFKLKPNSLVYLNSCQAGMPFATDMRNAFLGAGASAVIAFDEDIEANQGIKISTYWISRLLGVPDPEVDGDKPPQRPWDVDSILAEAHTLQLDFTTLDRNGMPVRANLHVFRNGGSEEMLAPSIKYLDVSEPTHSLVVTGDFGKDPGDQGKVTVGTSDCKVQKWTETEVDCDLGVSDFKSGDVIVRSRERRSNAVPLTAWKFTANSDFEVPPKVPGNFDFAWSFDVHIRGDVHKYRDAKPSDEGKNRDEYAVYGAPDSQCIPQPQGYLQVKGVKVAAAKVAPIAASSAPGAGGTCVFYGRLDARAKTLKFAIMAQQAASALPYVVTGPQAVGIAKAPFVLWPNMSDGDIPFSFKPQLPPGLPPEVLAKIADKLAAKTVLLKSVTLQFDDKWNLREFTKTGGDGGIKATLAVHAIAPDHAPDDAKTPR